MHILHPDNRRFVACADLHREKTKRKALAIYATLEREKKNGYTIASDGENLHVLEFFAVGNKGKTVLFYSVNGSVRFSTFKFASFFNM